MRKLFLAFAAVAMIAPASAQADIVLNIDLSIVDEITISATGGFSSVTISGSSTIGIYFEDFYGGAGGGLAESLVGLADLTNAENPSDGTPNLFRADGGADPGLNLFSWSTDGTVDFTAGSVAFVGSATWSLSAAEYVEMLAGATGGDIYFPADNVGGLAGATVIGQFSVTRAVPEPGSSALLGIFGVACIVRRRRV